MLKMLTKILSTSEVHPETYPKLNQSLINCLKESLGEKWSQKYESSWKSFLLYINQIMKDFVPKNPNYNTYIQQ